MNLYGYAGGDPVNYSDPFGLMPDCKGLWDCLKSFAAYEWRGFQAGTDPTRTSINFAEEGQFRALAGRLSLALPTARGYPGRAAAGTSAGDDIFAAAQAGGKHAGFLRNYTGRSPGELNRAMRSLQGHIQGNRSVG